MALQPSQFGLLERSMAFASKIQEVASQNVANVNTPGYQAREINFEDNLDALLNVTNTASARTFTVSTSQAVPGRGDENNVDIDLELANLNKAALMFQTFSELLSTRLNQMRSAIKLG